MKRRTPWFTAAAAAGTAAIFVGLGPGASASADHGMTMPMKASSTVVTDGILTSPWHAILPKNSEAIVTKLTLAPGGTTGWHTHAAAVLVVVDEGTASLYYAKDPACRAHRYTEGDAFQEVPGVVHTARNETRKKLVMTVIFLVPPKGNPMIDEPRPGNCAF